MFLNVKRTVSRYSSVKHLFRYSQVRLVKANTNTGRYLLAGRSAFEGRSGRDTIILYMVWGLKKQDLSDCKSWEIDCPGRTVWDDKFDMNSEFAQLALLVSTQRRENAFSIRGIAMKKKFSKNPIFLWKWVGGSRANSDLLWKIVPNSPKPVIIFWSRIPSVFCLYC